MSNGQEFEEIELERYARRRVFYLTFAALVLIVGGFLIWKLSILILPIIVGALLAFVFRPVKERFRVRWLPHQIKCCVPSQLSVWSCFSHSIPFANTFLTKSKSSNSKCG